MKTLWMFCFLFFQFFAICNGYAQWIVETYSNTDGSRLHNYGVVLNDGPKTFVGGKNYVLVIDKRSKSIEKVDFPVAEDSLIECSKNISEEQEEICSNGMILIEKVNSSFYLTCGTNAFSPECYYLNILSFSFSIIDSDVEYYFPLSPNTLTPAELVRNNLDEYLYYGFCENLSNCSFILLTNNVVKLSLPDNHTSFFTAPVFHDIYFHDIFNPKVFLFYRDRSNIFFDDIFTENGQTDEYGYVARVCLSDEGGSENYSENFMTFMRARLLCPYKAKSSAGYENILYYNNLRAVSRMGDTVYALFTLPSTWNYNGSAICAYSFEKIDAIIDGSAYENDITQYYDPDSDTLVGTYSNTSDIFQPGQCPRPEQPTSTLNESFADFLYSKTLVAKPVSPLTGSPLHVTPGVNFDFLTISEALDYHVLYLVRANSYMKTIRVTPLHSSFDPVELTETQIFNNETILSVSVNKQTMMVVTNMTVYQLNPSYCAMYNNCHLCEADPYCEWELTNELFVCNNAPSGDYNLRPCSPIPPAPINLSDSGVYPPITLHWERGGEGSDKYLVEVRELMSNDVVYHDVVPTTDIELDEFVLSDGTKYIAYVQAVNGLTLNTQVITHIFYTEVRKPELLLVTTSETSGTLAWANIPSATAYDMYVYSYPALRLARNYVFKPNPARTNHTFTSHGLDTGQQYKVFMRAVSDDLIESETSSILFNTKLPSPELSLRHVQQSVAVLVWEPMMTATYYNIVISRLPDDEIVQQYQVMQPNLLSAEIISEIQNLDSMQAYQVSVTAISNDTSVSIPTSIRLNTIASSVSSFTWFLIVLVVFETACLGSVVYSNVADRKRKAKKKSSVSIITRTESDGQKKQMKITKIPD